jgi:hypothetical protein
MKTNENKQEELDKLIKRFDIFYELLLKNETSEKIFSQARDIAYNAYKSNNLTILKRINKELDVWFREMPFDSQFELKQILKEKLNEEIIDKTLDKIKKVVKRGVINNLKEYKLILNRVDEIYADDDKYEEIIKLNELLVDYHKKTDKKL